MFGVFVQADCVCLKQGCHLVDKRTGTSGADPIHTLLNGTSLKINNLGVFTAKFDCDICLRRQLLQRGRHGNDLLDKGDFEVIGKSQSPDPVMTGWTVRSPVWLQALSRSAARVSCIFAKCRS